MYDNVEKKKLSVTIFRNKPINYFKRKTIEPEGILEQLYTHSFIFCLGSKSWLVSIRYLMNDK